MSLLSRVTALFTITSLLAAPAFANHGTPTATSRAPYGHRDAVRSLTLAFERLDVRAQYGQLFVDYRAEKASFKNMKKLGIEPVLVVEAGRHRFDARLKKRKGTLVFDIGRAEPRQVTLSVGGRSGRFRLDSLQLGRRVNAHVVLPLDVRGPGYGSHVPPPPPAAPLPWSYTPAVIQACGNAFVGGYNESECLRIVDRFAYHPGPAIRACDDAMVGDANALACLRTAANAAFDPSNQLRACEAAFVGNPNELSCFAKAVTATFDMAPTIRACEQAFVGDFNALRCIDESLTLAWNPVPIIQACERHTIGDAAALACLARS